MNSPVARPVRWIISLLAAASALCTLIRPETGGWMLVGSGLAAAVGGFAAAARSGRNDKWAWTFLGISQLLNGVGNLTFAAPTSIWAPSPGQASWLFNGATFTMVVGLGAFISPARGWRPLVAYATDLTILCACMFVVAWSLDLAPRLLDKPSDSGNLDSVMGVVALALDVIGVATVWPLVRSRPGRQKIPVLLAWGGLLFALVGDNDVTTTVFRLAPPMTPDLMWVLSSLLVLVGSVHVQQREILVHRLRHQFTLDLALAGVIITAVLTAWNKVANDDLTTSIFTAALVVQLVRCGLLFVRFRRMNRQLIDAASIDPLTGLVNRYRFEQILHDRLDATGAATVMFCDLDGFKEINDTHGHRLGDKVLAEVANRLLDVVGDTAIIARMGGDEFTVLLSYGIGFEGAMELIARMQAGVAQPIPIGAEQLQVSVSLGITQDDQGDAEHALMRADLALYAAKAAGRGTFRIYDAAMGDSMNQRFLSAQHFREALHLGQFTFDFQPITGLEPGHRSRYEALLRWRVEGRQGVPPEEILSTALYLGMLPKLTEYSIATIFSAVAARHSQGNDVEVAINLTSQQVCLPGMLPTISEALERNHFPARCITIEVTERTPDQTSELIPVLLQIRNLGIRIALDEFGVGYSNYSDLVALPLDELKLDRSLIANAVADHTGRSAKALASMVALAHELGLSVTLQGVETTEQLILAHELNVDEAQGRLLGRPQPMSKVPVAGSS